MHDSALMTVFKKLTQVVRKVSILLASYGTGDRENGRIFPPYMSKLKSAEKNLTGLCAAHYNLNNGKAYQVLPLKKK